VSDEETTATPSDDATAAPTDSSPGPVAPEPSYTPGPALGDFLMTVERGLQVVQEPLPSFERKGSDQDAKPD